MQKVHCVVDNPFLDPNCNSDEHNKFSFLIRIIQSKNAKNATQRNRPKIARTT